MGSEGPKKLLEYLIVSVCKIKKKLGGQLHKEVGTKVLKTFEEEKPELHKEWIKILLERYYDPMYIHQLSQKKDRVIFSGTFPDVRDWIRSLQNLIFCAPLPFFMDRFNLTLVNN